MHTDPDFERLVRQMNGEKTSAEIVQETSEAFGRRLDAIMRPAPGNHDFQTQAKSGIRICTRCGKADMKRVRMTACDGVDTTDWPN